MKNATLILCLAIILGLSIVANATEADQIKLYGSVGNTTNLHYEDEYYQFDYVRTGMCVYKNDFMLKVEYDLETTSLKWAYLEYHKPVNGWDLGCYVGKRAVPAMSNYPGPSKRPLPRYGYAIKDLSVAMTGIRCYAEKGIFRLDVANFGYEKYAANVKVGPLQVWWTKDQGQGMFFKESFNSWINLFAGWTNYEDRASRLFPERRNVAFVQNHFCLNEQLRVYTQTDFGDFDEQASDIEFVGGIQYRLFPDDEESTIGIFYDTLKKWQIRFTYGFDKII